MAAPVESRTLADTGGLVVIDDGRRVLVFDRCTSALTALAFVLGVLSLVVGGFGVVAARVEHGAAGRADVRLRLVLAAGCGRPRASLLRPFGRRRSSKAAHHCRLRCSSAELQK